MFICNCVNVIILLIIKENHVVLFLYYWRQIINFIYLKGNFSNNNSIKEDNLAMIIELYLENNLFLYNLIWHSKVLSII